MDADQMREKISRLNPVILDDTPFVITPDPAFESINKMADSLTAAMGSASSLNKQTAEALADRIIMLADYLMAYIGRRLEDEAKIQLKHKKMVG